MKTPVIIPAFNEAAHIKTTLEHLQPETLEPIVAINGQEGADETAAVAEQFGATVFRRPEQGKLPAVQAVLHHLGERALEPLLLLDGDTYPILPSRWQTTLTRQLVANGEQPSGVGGPVWYTAGSVKETALRSLWRIHKAREFSHVQAPAQLGYQLGPNMGLKLQTNATLQAILDLPHLWPAEDRALGQVILDQGGSFYQTINPRALALTPTSQSFISLQQRRSLSSEQASGIVRQHYIDRAAPGSTPYEQE